MSAAANRLKSPPFGRELADARLRRQYCNPWIFVGRGAWQLAARRGPGRIVLPAGADPADFSWSCLARLDVVVRWPGSSVQEVDALGALLVRSGARTVLVLEDARRDWQERRYVLRPCRRYVARRDECPLIP